MSTHVALLPVRQPANPVQALRHAALNVVRWYERRRAVGELHALPDHLLRDIGIERGSIDEAVVGLLLNARRAAG